MMLRINFSGSSLESRIFVCFVFPLAMLDGGIFLELTSSCDFCETNDL